MATLGENCYEAQNVDGGVVVEETRKWWKRGKRDVGGHRKLR